MAKKEKAANGELKDRDGRGGKDERSRADEKIGSGKKTSKLVVQPKLSEGQDEALSHRGMWDGDSVKHWKATGLKVPTSVHENHHSGKKK